MIRITIACFGLLVVGLSVTTPPVLAQGPQTGSIAGTIRDTTGAALVGAAVTLSGPNLIGGDRKITSDARGAYRFVALPLGLYEVTAEAPRFKTVRRGDLRVPIGGTITLDVELELGSLGEIVEVTATRGTIDRLSAAAPTYVDEALLQNLPVRRDLSSVINLTPGVTAGVAFGGTQGSNAVFVDGVNMTEPSFGGRSESFNTNWLQEVQVVALGASAEHGGTSGATVNAVLRSGSNRLSGLARFLLPSRIRRIWRGIRA